MPVTVKLVPIPVPQQPVVDPNTGLPTKDWYDYMKSIDSAVRAILQEIP